MKLNEILLLELAATDAWINDKGKLIYLKRKVYHGKWILDYMKTKNPKLHKELMAIHKKDPEKSEYIGVRDEMLKKGWIALSSYAVFVGTLGKAKINSEGIEEYFLKHGGAHLMLYTIDNDDMWAFKGSDVKEWGLYHILKAPRKFS